MDIAEGEVYSEPVIYAKSSPYQRLVLTKQQDELRLYLNGHLQFSSRDEYRYHEALVHPGLARVAQPRRVLILGGGDGMAAREVLRYPTVERITLVDLDPAVTALFRESEMLSALNQQSLHSEKLEVVNADAFTWLRDNTHQFDFIVVDFPDPTNFSVGKLYTDYFFKRLRAALTSDGIVALQATSPLIARRSFWCIVSTMESAGFITAAYHVYVPSFTEWGFVLASKNSLPSLGELPRDLRFVTAQSLPQLFTFPPDMERIESEINKLSTQVLVKYYDEEWSRYN